MASKKQTVKITCRSTDSVHMRVHKDMARVINNASKDIAQKLGNKSKINSFDVSKVYASKLLAGRLRK